MPLNTLTVCKDWKKNGMKPAKTDLQHTSIYPQESINYKFAPATAMEYGLITYALSPSMFYPLSGKHTGLGYSISSCLFYSPLSSYTFYSISTG